MNRDREENRSRGKDTDYNSCGDVERAPPPVVVLVGELEVA